MIFQQVLKLIMQTVYNNCTVWVYGGMQEVGNNSGTMIQGDENSVENKKWVNIRQPIHERLIMIIPMVMIPQHEFINIMFK